MREVVMTLMQDVLELWPGQYREGWQLGSLARTRDLRDLFCVLPLSEAKGTLEPLLMDIFPLAHVWLWPGARFSKNLRKIRKFFLRTL